MSVTGGVATERVPTVGRTEVLLVECGLTLGDLETRREAEGLGFGSPVTGIGGGPCQDSPGKEP